MWLEEATPPFVPLAAKLWARLGCSPRQPKRAAVEPAAVGASVAAVDGVEGPFAVAPEKSPPKPRAPLISERPLTRRGAKLIAPTPPPTPLFSTPLPERPNAKPLPARRRYGAVPRPWRRGGEAPPTTVAKESAGAIVGCVTERRIEVSSTIPYSSEFVAAAPPPPSCCSSC